MKKAVVISAIVAVVGCIASVLALFYWLTKQLEFMPADIEDDDFFL